MVQKNWKCSIEKDRQKNSKKAYLSQTFRFFYFNFFHLIGLSSPSCNFPFEDLTDAEDSLTSDTEDNAMLGISTCACLSSSYILRLRSRKKKIYIYGVPCRGRRIFRISIGKINAVVPVHRKLSFFHTLSSFLHSRSWYSEIIGEFDFPMVNEYPRAIEFNLRIFFQSSFVLNSNKKKKKRENKISRTSLDDNSSKIY